MDFEEFKKYIDSIIDNEKFKELNKFTGMMDYDEKLDIYENIKSYLALQHPRHDCKEHFQPDYQHFIKFLEYYLKGIASEVIVNDKGYINLQNMLYMAQPPYMLKRAGVFTDKEIMFTDGSRYFSKLPLNYIGKSGVSNRSCIFAPIIASHIAKMLNVDSAEFYLGQVHNGNRILSKNFLKENEKIISLTDETYTISEHLSGMEQELKRAGYPQEEIENAKFEFLKQEFVAKLIGLKDQKPDNSPLIEFKDKDGNKHIKMAPMLDFDYSFHIGEERSDMLIRKCDNENTDIGSFIQEFKDYPGFLEFVKNSLDKLDMKQVYSNIFEETGITYFTEYEDNTEIMKFIEYVNKNIEKAKETVAEIDKKEDIGIKSLIDNNDTLEKVATTLYSSLSKKIDVRKFVVGNMVESNMKGYIVETLEKIGISPEEAEKIIDRMVEIINKRENDIEDNIR